MQVADQKCEALLDAAVALFIYMVALTLISISQSSTPAKSLRYCVPVSPATSLLLPLLLTQSCIVVSDNNSVGMVGT